MPTTITSAGVTFTDTTTLTSANGVPSALKLTTARTINGVSFDGTADITVPASGTSAAKAWVNWDGTATSPIAPRASYNVSSVTRNSTGNFTINFATPLTDANYSFALGHNWQGGVVNFAMLNGGTKTANALQVLLSDGSQSGNVVNTTQMNCVIFGN
jgi:hypothetical protein